MSAGVEKSNVDGSDGDERTECAVDGFVWGVVA